MWKPWMCQQLIAGSHRNKQPFTFIIVNDQNINLSIISLFSRETKAMCACCTWLSPKARDRKKKAIRLNREVKPFLVVGQFHLTVVFSFPPQLFFSFSGSNLNKRKKWTFGGSSRDTSAPFLSFPFYFRAR